MKHVCNADNKCHPEGVPSEGWGPRTGLREVSIRLVTLLHQYIFDKHVSLFNFFFTQPFTKHFWLAIIITLYNNLRRKVSRSKQQKGNPLGICNLEDLRQKTGNRKFKTANFPQSQCKDRGAKQAVMKFPQIG